MADSKLLLLLIHLLLELSSLISILFLPIVILLQLYDFLVVLIHPCRSSRSQLSFIHQGPWVLKFGNAFELRGQCIYRLWPQLFFDHHLDRVFILKRRFFHEFWRVHQWFAFFVTSRSIRPSYAVHLWLIICSFSMDSFAIISIPLGFVFTPDFLHLQMRHNVGDSKHRFTSEWVCVEGLKKEMHFFIAIF